MRILLDDIEREIWKIEKADIPDLKGYLLIGDYPSTHHIDDFTNREKAWDEWLNADPIPDIPTFNVEDPSYYGPRLDRDRYLTDKMTSDPRWKDNEIVEWIVDGENETFRASSSWDGVDD